LTGKTLIVYLSMGFGNPYGDPYSPAIVADFAQQLAALGVRIVALSDTIGVSTPALIMPLFKELIPAFPHIEFGAHLHTTPTTWRGKVQAAYQAGCRRFDGALGGIGGCPMATDVLTGNMATENIVAFLAEQGEELGLNLTELNRAQLTAMELLVEA
ncbi:MAG: hydroxymethylglutaryl-CoA lyase, partial [Hymenobacter sp.]